MLRHQLPYQNQEKLFYRHKGFQKEPDEALTAFRLQQLYVRHLVRQHSEQRI